MLIRKKVGVTLINAIRGTLKCRNNEKGGRYFMAVECKVPRKNREPKLTDPVGVQARNGPFRSIEGNDRFIHAVDILGDPWIFRIARWHFITVKNGRKVAKKALEDYYWDSEVKKAI